MGHLTCPSAVSSVASNPQANSVSQIGKPYLVYMCMCLLRYLTCHRGVGRHYNAGVCGGATYVSARMECKRFGAAKFDERDEIATADGFPPPASKLPVDIGASSGTAHGYGGISTQFRICNTVKFASLRLKLHPSILSADDATWLIPATEQPRRLNVRKCADTFVNLLHPIDIFFHSPLDRTSHV